MMSQSIIDADKTADRIGGSPGRARPTAMIASAFAHCTDRLLASIRTHRGQINRFGPLGWALWQYALRSRSKGKGLGHRIWPRDAAYPLRFRPDTSDLAVCWQIFYEREYACLDDVREPRLIIDCGANVGYSSAYFLTRFPSAHVIAVEPDPENFALLQDNLRPYGRRAACIQAGLWSHPCGLVFEAEPYRDGGKWAVRVREAVAGETPALQALDLESVVRDSGADRVDILKVDIERSERVVFGSNYAAWLGRCDNLAIEIHDQECEEVVSRAVSHYPFTRGESGELAIFRRVPVPPPAAANSRQAALRYSVVIVSYRRQGPLCDTLRALAPQIDPTQGEVIVVDQCPLGPLPADVLATPGLRYLAPDVPGMVRSRNIGINEARGDVVLFLDDDVIPWPGLIDGHLSAYVEPEVGGVAGRILDPGREAENPPADPRSFDPVEGWQFAHFDHSVAGDVMTARGCNMSFRRELLIRLGGFDPELAIFRDDTDMCLRVIAAGYKIRFAPAAALIHLNAPTGGTRGPTEAADYWTRELRMYRQHYRHYRDNLYFLVKHFHGGTRNRWVWDAYRSYVGLSRWPWRLAAKNACFLAALFQAARLAQYRKHHPCVLDPFHQPD